MGIFLLLLAVSAFASSVVCFYKYYKEKKKAYILWGILLSAVSFFCAAYLFIIEGLFGAIK